MTSRRVFLARALSFLAAPLAAGAQQTGKVWRVGWLSDGSPGPVAHLRRAFLEGLRDLGYSEGQNITLEYRFAEGRIDRLPDLAAELVRLNVDVIVTLGGVPATDAAKHVTSTIPIVMSYSGDPVSTGLVASLSRPGGNVTGLTVADPEITGRRLQLLKEAAPKISRVAVLYHPTFPATVLGVKDAQVAAPKLGLTVLPIKGEASTELDNVFATMIRLRADALLTFGDPFTTTHQGRIVDFAARSRLPAIHVYRDLALAGGLMSYGPSLPDMFRRAAAFVDKILKGAKPGELPVEQPTKFELMINLKTAKALGLTIPPSLLLRADQVIQ